MSENAEEQTMLTPQLDDSASVDLDMADDLEEVEPLVFRLQDLVSGLVGERGLNENGEPILPDGSDMLADFVAYKGYEIRDSQAEIVDETIEAFFVTKDAEDEEDYENGFAAGTDVLLNAPVATGKSAAAIFSGLGVQQRIVLASSNKSLQQQYIDKDIPEIAEFLKSEYDYDLTYSIMKGQYNYANLVNLREALDGTSEFEVFASLSSEERWLIQSIVEQSETALEQVANTGTSKLLDCGDLIARLPKKMQRLASAASPNGKARWLDWAARCHVEIGEEYTEQDVLDDSERIFNGTSSDEFSFVFEDSPYSTAYFLAMTSDIVVANQSLLIADLKRTHGMSKFVGPERAMIYPSLVRGAGFICVDEAQHYPANVTSALSKNFSLASYADVLDRCVRRLDKIGIEGSALIEKYTSMLELVDNAHNIVRDSQEKVDDETGEPVVDAEEIVELLRTLYDDLEREFKIVNGMTFNKPSLSKMLAKSFEKNNSSLSDTFSDLHADEVVGNRKSREMKAILRCVTEVNEGIIQHLGEFEPDDAWSVTVTSAEQWNPNAKRDEPTNYIINMTPLDIRSHRAEVLQLQQMPNVYALGYGQKLWNGLYGTMMVLMSGTLSKFVGPKIGMSAENYVSVDSPMDARRTRLCVPDDLPAPSGRDYMKWVSASTERVVEMVKLVRGRTMVLCTSNNTMNEYAAALRKKVPSVRVIAQNDMDKKAAIELFKLEEHAVILGMKSFWEGVDIPGDDLLLVIMDKIMFPIQDDPIYGALSEAEDMNGGDPFLNVTVDHAAFMFAQGAGRLQRSESDFGGILLLDPRVTTARYGSRVVSLAPKKMPFTSNYDRFKKYMERVRASVDDAAEQPKPPKITDDAENWTSLKNCGVKGANRKRRSADSGSSRRRF